MISNFLTQSRQKNLAEKGTRALRAAVTWSLRPLCFAPPIDEQVRDFLALDPAV